MTTVQETTVTFRCISCNHEETVRVQAVTASPWHCFSPMMKVSK